jgi:sugar phosphate isomerase/epimerase
LRSRALTVRAGRLPEESDAAGLARLRDVLRDLSRYGNHIGVVLALTSAGDPPAVLVNLISEIKDGPLGIDFDPAGCALAGRSAAAHLREAHRGVTHVQVRDAIRDTDGTGREVPVGRGEVDWPEILALLGEIAYTGWLTVRRTSGEDVPGDCVRAVTFLRSVAAGG